MFTIIYWLGFALTAGLLGYVFRRAHKTPTLILVSLFWPLVLLFAIEYALGILARGILARGKD